MSVAIAILSWLIISPTLSGTPTHDTTHTFKSASDALYVTREDSQVLLTPPILFTPGKEVARITT